MFYFGFGGNRANDESQGAGGSRDAVTWGRWAGDTSEAGNPNTRGHPSGYGLMLPAEKNPEPPTVNIQKVFAFKNPVTRQIFITPTGEQPTGDAAGSPNANISPLLVLGTSLLRPICKLDANPFKHSIFRPRIFLLQLWPKFAALSSYRSKIQCVRDSLETLKQENSTSASFRWVLCGLLLFTFFHWSLTVGN